jgi:hypothetical protein
LTKQFACGTIVIYYSASFCDFSIFTHIFTVIFVRIFSIAQLISKCNSRLKYFCENFQKFLKIPLYIVFFYLIYIQNWWLSAAATILRRGDLFYGTSGETWQKHPHELWKD